MQKILISEWVPAQCLASYEGKFSFTLPSEEKHAFSYEELLEQIPDYDGCLILDNDGDRRLLDAGKNLKVIANFGVGYDNIDWNYATQIGLPGSQHSHPGHRGHRRAHRNDDRLRHAGHRTV